MQIEAHEVEIMSEQPTIPLLVNDADTLRLAVSQREV